MTPGFSSGTPIGYYFLPPRLPSLSKDWSITTPLPMDPLVSQTHQGGTPLSRDTPSIEKSSLKSLHRRINPFPSYRCFQSVMGGLRSTRLPRTPIPVLLVQEVFRTLSCSVCRPPEPTVITRPGISKSNSQVIDEIEEEKDSSTQEGPKGRRGSHFPHIKDRGFPCWEEDSTEGS